MAKVASKKWTYKYEGNHEAWAVVHGGVWIADFNTQSEAAAYCAWRNRDVPEAKMAKVLANLLKTAEKYVEMLEFTSAGKHRHLHEVERDGHLHPTIITARKTIAKYNNRQT